MTKSRCPHCRQKLGNYLYATTCPFCQKELVHNRVPTGLDQPAGSHSMGLMWTGAVVAGGAYALLKAAGIWVPGTEVSSFAGQTLWFLGCSLLGAIAGVLLGVMLFRYGKKEKLRTQAFLAQFPMPAPLAPSLPIKL